jgi:transcriptional regulator with XRE-family HTH domain
MPRRSRDIPEEYSEHEQAIAKAIGARVRRRRRQLGLTQEDTRARMELESIYVSSTQFSRIENGESLLNAAEVIALSSALKIPCNWLLLGDDATLK